MKKIKILKHVVVFALINIMATMTGGPANGEVISTLDPSPARIAFNGNGDLLVTDYTFGQVLTVAPDTLDIIGEINIDGRPLGVAWSNDYIYVGNSTTGQVEVYDEFGLEQFVLGFGSNPVGIPLDIAVGNGNVYVVDGSADVVQIFSQDGIFIGTIPQNGHDPEVLANPTAIAVDEANRQIYISDYGDLGLEKVIDPRIQAFDYEGNLLYTIESGSANKYRFTMPQGLTVNNNQLYAVDSLTAEIHIFDTADGTLISKVKGSGIDAGTFMMQLPLDLVIDSTTNNVFVTNNMMASIKVFPGAGGK